MILAGEPCGHHYPKTAIVVPVVRVVPVALSAPNVVCDSAPMTSKCAGGHAPATLAIVGGASPQPPTPSPLRTAERRRGEDGEDDGEEKGGRRALGQRIVCPIRLLGGRERGRRLGRCRHTIDGALLPAAEQLADFGHHDGDVLVLALSLIHISEPTRPY